MEALSIAIEPRLLLRAGLNCTTRQLNPKKPEFYPLAKEKRQSLLLALRLTERTIEELLTMSPQTVPSRFAGAARVATRHICDHAA